MTGLAIICALLLATCLALGKVAFQASRDAAHLGNVVARNATMMASLEADVRQAEDRAELADERVASRTRLLDAAVYVAGVYKEDRDKARREAAMYRVAFDAVMLKQVREAELRPDEARGVAEVVELPVKKGRRA